MPQPNLDVIDAHGATVNVFTISPSGRAAEAASQTVTMCTEDFAVLSNILAALASPIAISGTVTATISAGAATIAKAEDSASANGDVGVPAIAIQAAVPSDLAGTDLDYAILQMSGGRLWVDASGKTLTVASHAVTNAGTFAVQAAQSGVWTVQPGNTANTTAWKVDGSAVTQPVSAASLPLPTGASTSALQTTGNTSLTAILADLDTLAAVAQSQDTSSGGQHGFPALFIRKDTPANGTSTDGFYDYPQMSGGRIWTSSIITAGTVSVSSSALPTGASTSAKQPALGTAGTASADVITVQGIASMTPLLVTATASGTGDVNLKQLNGNTVSVGNGVTGTGVLRVAQVSDGTGKIATVDTITNAVTVIGGAASGSAKSGNPVQGGWVFNTTQPTVASGSVVEAQATTRGGLIVSTGVDTFNVTVNASLPAGTAIIGKVSVDQSTPGTTNAVSLSQINGTTAAVGNGVVGNGVQRVSIASDNTAFAVNAAITAASGSIASGAVASGAFASGSIASGAIAVGAIAAGATSIAANEDDASADGDRGIKILARRTATPANTSGADLDYEMLQMAAGRLWVSATIDAALPAGAALIGKVGLDQTTPGTTNAASIAQLGANTVSTGNGASGTGVLRVAQVNDGTGILATVSTVTNLSQMGGVAIALNTGVRSTGTQRVTIATDDLVQAVGAVAHDAAISGNPVRTSGRALTADYTAVSTGDTADLITTVLGKQVTMPYALPGATWKYVGAAGGIVNTTAITIASAAGAGIKNYITSIVLVNSHQTIGTEVVINDGAAGTAIFRTWCQFAGGGCALNFVPPLASTANTLLEIKEVSTTATAGIVAEVIGYTAAE